MSALRNIGEIEEPLARVAAWILEREALRQRKEVGEPWPWTVCPLLTHAGSFTNVRREDDKTSRWCAAHVRSPFAESPDLFPAVVLFLLFNRIRTGETIFTAPDGGTTPFEEARAADSLAPLQRALAQQGPPYIGAAYVVSSISNLGLSKEAGLLVAWKLWLDGSGWRKRHGRWMRSPPPLAEAHAWFMKIRGVGGFIAAQLIACLKHVEPLSGAPDWWTWAAPGPGSKPGLNLACGFAIDAKPSDARWLASLQAVAKVLTPRIEAAGISPLHMQDWQNVMCETAKLWRVARGGRLKQSWRPPLDRLPATESDLATRVEELHADACRRFALAGLDERFVPDRTAVVAEIGEAWRGMTGGTHGRRQSGS